jgi:hypothetical protein
MERRVKMKQKRSAVIGFFVLLIVVVLSGCNTDSLPDPNKPIFIDATLKDDQRTYEIVAILNNDKTGSITNKTENGYSEQGKWEISTQNSEMIKIIFKSSSGNSLVSIYKGGEASITVGSKQCLGNWHQ